MRRTRSAIVVSLTAVMCLTFTSAPASATHGPNVIFNSSNNSAQTQFYESGEHLYACDIASDGLRAVAIAEWFANGFWRRAEVHDADGANGNCAGHANLDIIDHTNVRLYACAQNGSNGTPQYCTYYDTIA